MFHAILSMSQSQVKWFFFSRQFLLSFFTFPFLYISGCFCHFELIYFWAFFFLLDSTKKTMLLFQAHQTAHLNCPFCYKLAWARRNEKEETKKETYPLSRHWMSGLLRIDANPYLPKQKSVFALRICWEIVGNAQTTRGSCFRSQDLPNSSNGRLIWSIFSFGNQDGWTWPLTLHHVHSHLLRDLPRSPLHRGLHHRVRTGTRRLGRPATLKMIWCSCPPSALKERSEEFSVFLIFFKSMLLYPYVPVVFSMNSETSDASGTYQRGRTPRGRAGQPKLCVIVGNVKVPASPSPPSSSWWRKFLHSFKFPLFLSHFARFV